MEHYKKGIDSLEKFLGPAAKPVLKKLESLPKNYANNMLQTYGLHLTLLEREFPIREIAIASLAYRLGAHLDLATGVFGMLHAGFTKEEIDEAISGITLLSGYGRAGSVWDEINAAYAIWDSVSK